MPVACHPNSFWDWCMSEDGKKSRSNVYWRVAKVCVGSIQYWDIETFSWGVYG